MEIKNRPFAVASSAILFVAMMAGVTANLDNGLLVTFFIIVAIFNAMTAIRRMSYNYIEIDEDDFVMYNDLWTTDRYDMTGLTKVESDGSTIKLHFGDETVAVSKPRISEDDQVELESYLNLRIAY